MVPNFPFLFLTRVLRNVYFLSRLVSASATEVLGGDPEGDVTAANAEALIKDLARQVPVPPS